MRHLPEERRLMLVQALLTGESIKKAAARVGTGNDMVSRTLLDLGTACREHHDRTVQRLAIDGVRCRRVWSFSYVRRRNAYTPESNRGIPREGWAWVALHAESGLVVDWAVTSGDAQAAGTFIHRVRGRMLGRIAVTAEGRDVVLKQAGGNGADAGEAALLARLFGTEGGDERHEPDAGPVAGDFRRRCLNLELALSLHFTSHNFIAVADGEPAAVRFGLVDRAWSLESLADLA